MLLEPIVVDPACQARFCQRDASGSVAFYTRVAASSACRLPFSRPLLRKEPRQDPGHGDDIVARTARDAIVDSSRQFFNRETRSTPRGAEREKEKQGISTIKVARARRLVCLAKVFLRPVRRKCADPAARIGASHHSGEFSFPCCRRFYSEAAFCALHTSRSSPSQGRMHDARLHREDALSRIKRVTEIYSSRKYIRLQNATNKKF